MNSVRIFATDPDSRLVERLGRELSWTNPREVLCVYWTLLLRVSGERPTGVLDDVTPAQLAKWAGVTLPPDFFLRALLQAGVLCRPYQDLRHRKCTAPSRWGTDDHPSATLAVCGWDTRQGPAYRAYCHNLTRGEGRSWRPAKKSAHGNRPVGRRTPPSAHRGASTTGQGVTSAAPVGQGPETAALQGGDGGRPTGRPSAPEGVARGITTYDGRPTGASPDHAEPPRRAVNLPTAPPYMGGGHNPSVSGDRPVGRPEAPESGSPPYDRTERLSSVHDTPGGSPPPAPPPLGGGGRGAGGAALAREGDGPGPERLSDVANRAIKRALRPWTGSRWDAAWKKYLSVSKSKGLREPEALHLFEQANGPRPSGEKGGRDAGTDAA